MSRDPCFAVLLVILSILLTGCDGGGDGDGWILKDLGTGPRTCDDGRAGFFACSGISLEKRISLAALCGGAGNDIWGWVDPESERESAL
ncbi:MAG: hypothetical protein HUJ31_07345, partial [Pseudomonadales bacterium]|nr:hypothetical protein [Pseudomonadales bacterium]